MDSDNFLKQIVKGAGIIFLATILLYLSHFFYKLIIARYLGPENYGLISLGLAILNVGSIFSLFGFNRGVSRFLPKYLEEKDYASIKGTILSAIKIVSFLSLIISILLLVFSRYIAENIFNNINFVPVLIIFALVLPFFNLIRIFSSFCLSYKKPEYNLFADTLGRHFLNFLLSVFVIILGGSILGISFVYLFANVFSTFLLFLIIQKKLFPIISRIKPIYHNKILFNFSFPLFLSGIFGVIMGWTDTLFLGFLKTSYDVGIYNVVLPLASAQAIFLSIFVGIFYPIMVQLDTRKKYSELKKIYSTVLRWIFLLNFPFFLILILFPQRILSIVYGSVYSVGAAALIILAFGYFIQVVVGPTMEVLMVFNKTKFILLLNIGISILNVILNLILIPIYGIVGAGLATTTSLIIRKLIMLFVLRKRIYFFKDTKFFVKYILSALVSVFSFYFIVSFTFIGKNLILLLVSLLFLPLIYFIMLLFLRSFDKDDIMIMNVVEKKIGLNLIFLRRLISRFL